MLSKTVLLVNVMLVVLNQTHQFQAGGANNAMQQRTVQINSSQNRKSVGKVQHVHHHYHSCTQRQNIQKSLAKISAKLDNLETKIICPDEPNIALKQPTAQSSTAFNGISFRAVDGNIDGAYWHNSCSHTDDAKSWWRVDLGSSKRVARVVIYNRVDCCNERLSNFDIRVGNSLKNNGNNNAICASGLSLAGKRMGEIHCQTPMTGRYLTIRLWKRNALTLCEVRVYSR